MLGGGRDEFAEENGDTLVLVVADHEIMGFSVFVNGSYAENFNGVMQNTEFADLNRRIRSRWFLAVENFKY